MLDLSDFNLKLIYVPGKDLFSPDTLSWHPDHILKFDNDNEGVTLLPQSLFVNLINTKLSAKIPKSSEKDPLVLNTLQALEWEVLTQFNLVSPTGHMRLGYLPTRDKFMFQIKTTFAKNLSLDSMTTKPLDILVI